ncbi:MAG: hypothetical protein IAE78_26600 [Myxococcus sp.]|nr:hypothetical protein [Myxococcus sp.]
MRRSVLSLVLALAACNQPLPSPTGIVDLRVIAASFEPPEVLISPCDPRLLVSLGAGGSASQLPPALLAQLLAIGQRPLTYRALVVDPQGNGRPLSYRLRACANTGDRECDNTDDFVELRSGSLPAGEWEFPLDGTAPERPLLGTALLPDGQPLLLEALTQDSSRGLGGIRIPVMLEVKASDTDEHIFAQKLMVVQCQFFPTMRQNVTPVLPGMLLRGEPWPEELVPEFKGSAEVAMEPADFAELEEPYTVPSLQLTPVNLVESWKIAWYATLGRMSSFETGGTNFDGKTERQRSRWQPDTTVKEPREVTFYFVVRDGRGGQSWLTRRAKWTP